MTRPNATALATLLFLAGCGGGGGATDVVIGADGNPITTSGGTAVTEEAHNHWREAIGQFESHDPDDWTPQTCEATLAKFQQANGAQGGSFTEAIYMMGVVNGRCGNDERALEFYRQAMSTNEDYCGSRVGVGLADMRAGRDPVARQHFERAIAADNRCTSAYVNLAIIQRRSPGQAAEALNNLRRALAIESDYLPAFNQMALLYLDQAENNSQMLDLAEVVCRQAQLMNPNYAPIYNTWGLINFRQDNIIAAIVKFERASNLDASIFEAHMNFGQLTLSYRGYQSAATAFERAAALQPQSYDVMVGWGAALRGLTQFDEAEVKYRAAIAIDAQRPEAYYNLGLLYQDYKGGQQAMLEQSQGFYRQFVQRAGSNAQWADAVTSVNRRCAQEQQGRRRRRGRRTCRPGRLQQVETALVLLREMQQMQQQAGGGAATPAPEANE